MIFLIFMKNKILNQDNIILFLFATFNIFLIAFLSLYSSVWVEVYKLFQFAIFLLVLFYFFYRINRFLGLLFLIFINTFYLFLVSYFIFTESHLSFSFLKMYMGGSSANILLMYKWPVVFLTFFSFLNVLGFISIRNKIFNRGRLLLFSIFLFILISFQAFYVDDWNNEIFVFAGSINGSDQVIDHYQKKQEQLINSSIRDKEFILNQAKNVDKRELPNFLDNIIILQIESLNHFLINEENTPNFLDFAHRGVWFKNFYGNSVQTILGQENILCGLPGSFNANLSENEKISDILCLPEFFNVLGYKTFFMKSYDLNFADTGKLMHALKFDEVQADGIMRDGDKKSKWGYREDIFYKRAFEHLEEKKQDKYNFAYIEVGPTNHWSFQTPEDLKELVPYQDPKNHQERLINTTFLQDVFLKEAFDRVKVMFPEGNYTILILGDHSWPAEIHPGNNFNEKGAFQENFMTSMIAVFGDESIWNGRIIETSYSQMDILPSFFDMFGVSYHNDYLKKSFVKELETGEYGQHKILLLQPFATKYLNIIDHDLKFQYSFDDKKWYSFNLKQDPMEEEMDSISDNKKNNLKAAKSFLPLFTENELIAHAMGGIENQIYTNSREAFELNYKNGKRIFEIDLMLTFDGGLIGQHDELPSDIKFSDFMSKKIKGKYTPLSFDDIINLMNDYQDIQIVSDIKSDFRESFTLITSKLKEQNNDDLFKRFIPQIYNENDFYYLKEKDIFKKIIYTLYKTDANDEQIYDLISNNKEINILTVFPNRFSKELTDKLNKLGVKTFVHTINDEETMLYFVNKGVSGFYTDFY